MVEPENTSEPDASELAAARLALLKRFLHRALADRDVLPRAFHNELVTAGILNPRSDDADSRLADILSRSDHEARVHPFPSPVLVYKDGETNQTVLDLNDLFFTSQRPIRQGVAAEARRLLDFLGLHRGEETDALLAALIDEDPRVWRAAAAQMRKSFEEEFLIVGFSYVHHSQIDIDNTLPERASKALAGSTAVRLFVERLKRLDDQAPIEAANLSQVRDYLAGPSAPRLIEFLSDRSSALARACSDATESAHKSVWAALSLLAAPRHSADTPPLRIALNEFAVHFIRVLESNYPGISQSFATNVAWTMANYLVTLSLLFPGALISLVDSQHTRDLFTEYRAYWQYAKPRLSTSTAYALTLSYLPPFIAAALGGRSHSADEKPPPDDQLQLATTALLIRTMIAAASAELETNRPLFLALNSLALKVTQNLMDDARKAEVSKIQSQLSRGLDKNELLQWYRNISAEDMPRDYLRLELSVGAVRRGAITIDDLIDIWRDAKWRSHLASADSDLIHMTISVCLSALEPATTEAGVSFCHLLAEFATSLKHDQKKYQMVVSNLLVAAVRSNTVSAVDRILWNSKEAEFVASVRAASAFLNSHAVAAPAWIAGKMRAVLASTAR